MSHVDCPHTLDWELLEESHPPLVLLESWGLSDGSAAGTALLMSSVKKAHSKQMSFNKQDEADSGFSLG